MNKNRVLGKGLSALIQGADLRGVAGLEGAAELLQRVPLDAIGFNPDQPRKFFDESTLGELADSIKQVGVLQPVLLRRLSPGEKVEVHPDSPGTPQDLIFGVVAGERRVRAARLAKLKDIPAIICGFQETEALKVALLENIQREDLGPIEEAEAFRHLMNAYGTTQDGLAEMLGKKRSTVANALRLLTLEEEVRLLVQEGKITRGHAKALLGLPAGPGRIQLARMCHTRGLSVRDCELRVQQGGAKPSRRSGLKAGRNRPPLDPAIRALQDRAEQVYGSPVVIEPQAGGKGTICLRFYSDSDLIRLLNIMGVDTDL